MSPQELQTAVSGLQRDIAALRTEVSALRTEIAPLLKWKAGIIALVGLIVTIGMLSRAFEAIVGLFHLK